MAGPGGGRQWQPNANGWQRSQPHGAPQAAGALQCRVAQVQDIGTYQMLTAQVGDHTIKARVAPEVALPAVGDSIWLQVLGEHTCFYQNEELLA